MPMATAEAQREYQRQWIANRRASFFEGKTCLKCGSIDDLELDHVDRTVEISHKIWSWSKSRQDRELLKCQVLCHDCHWSKTKDDLGWGNLTCGTLSKYKGC